MTSIDPTLDEAAEARIAGAVAELNAQAALCDVRRATRRLESAERNFEETLRDAAGKASQRRIAAACGRSLTRVNQIIHGTNR
jgi:mRNA degradation ribonuclease J1/J2